MKPETISNDISSIHIGRKKQDGYVTQFQRTCYLLQNLISFCFRKQQIALSADIKAVFLQVALRSDDS